jgi:hypothetical protein
MADRSSATSLAPTGKHTTEQSYVGLELAFLVFKPFKVNLWRIENLISDE